MNKTAIEWADSTWNPLTGCRHHCPYCYAERIAHRFCGDINANLKKENAYDFATAMYVLRKPFTNDEGVKIPYPFGFEPTFHLYRLDEPYILSGHKNVFVCSMSDMFGTWVPKSIISSVFESCTSNPQHNFLFLTKNPGRYEKLDREGLLPYADNMWYGTSVTNIADVDRMENAFDPLPRKTNTFISVEPITEDIAMSDTWKIVCRAPYYIKWVIIGAETGNRATRVIPKKRWIDRLVSDCNDFNIPVFMKDSLIPIVGEHYMKRQFPKLLKGGDCS